MVNHPTSKDAMQQKLEKKMIIPGTRCQWVRQFLKQTATTRIATESNITPTTQTTMDDPNKKKKS